MAKHYKIFKGSSTSEFLPTCTARNVGACYGEFDFYISKQNRQKMKRCKGSGGSRGEARAPLPLLLTPVILSKEKAQKEEKPAGQAKQNNPPPPHSKSGSATIRYRFVLDVRKGVSEN